MHQPGRASPDGGPAPVEYGEVRRWVRLSRGTLGGLLLALAGAAALYHLPGAPLKAAAAALVAGHTALMARRGGPTLPLTFDGIALTVTAGIGPWAEGPLVAAVAYLGTAAVLLIPRRAIVLPALALAAGSVLRVVVMPHQGTVPEGPGAVLANVEAGIYLLGLVLMVLGAADLMRKARRRQADALEAERRAAAMKNEFVSMVSHELRTPLTNIGGFAMALRESWRDFDPAEVEEFLSVICGETEHLRRLVDDVLVVPRLEVDRLLIEPADFPLRPAAFRIAGLVFPPGGGKTASVSISGGAVVHADPNRVEQVLRNLLENAAKYGGSQVSVEAAPQGGQWLVVVADDGPGVEVGQRERIFAPFEQEHPSASPGSGLGLGLTVSRVLVEAMGGRIWYEPGFPTGARFCFTLPAASPRPVAAPVAS